MHDANDEYLPIDAVFSDDNGIYILESKGPKKPEEANNKCFNKHPIWFWSCVGCAIPICKFRCKCVEWVFKVTK